MTPQTHSPAVSPVPKDTTTDPYILLGSVVRARGLKGEIVLYVHPSLAGAVVAGLELRLVRGQERLETRVSRAQTLKDKIVVSTPHILNREEAERWIKASVLVAPNALGGSEEGSYYDFELLGLDVMDRKQQRIGTIVEIVSSPANDVLVGHGSSGEFLIPATAHAILDVDRAAHCIRVDETALVYSGNEDGE